MLLVHDGNYRLGRMRRRDLVGRRDAVSLREHCTRRVFAGGSISNIRDHLGSRGGEEVEEEIDKD